MSRSSRSPETERFLKAVAESQRLNPDTSQGYLNHMTNKQRRAWNKAGRPMDLQWFKDNMPRNGDVLP